MKGGGREGDEGQGDGVKGRGERGAGEGKGGWGKSGGGRASENSHVAGYVSMWVLGLLVSTKGTASNEGCSSSDVCVSNQASIVVPNHFTGMPNLFTGKHGKADLEW